MGSRFDYDLDSHRFKVSFEKIEALHQPPLFSLGLGNHAPELSR